MKISAAVAMWLCVVFAALGFGVAIYGMLSITPEMDAKTRDDSMGFAMFWAFLGAIGVVFGALSWMMKTGKFGDVE